MQEYENELLELAAKAYGRPRTADWNPIHNSADTFSLAVNLNIDICFSTDGLLCVWFYVNDIVQTITGLPEKDAEAAARLAVTEAAAEIGKAMK